MVKQYWFYKLQILLFVILVFTISNCYTKNDLNVDVKLKNEKLELEVKKLKALTDFYLRSACISKQKADPENVPIYLYRPFGLRIDIINTRPLFSSYTYLSVPAAYTSKNTTIEGIFIREGKEYNNLNNAFLTGACIITKDSITIIKSAEVDNNLISLIKSKSWSFFQQTLLITDYEITECQLFGNVKNIRRALIKFDKYTCIAESIIPQTILEFQKSLKEINVRYAINLDMGTWSEGWYKGNNSEKIIIGETMFNTAKQTNWLVLTRDSIE